MPLTADDLERMETAAVVSASIRDPGPHEDVVALVEEVRRLTAELAKARSVVVGMREAVLEFELRPPDGEFVALKDGKVYATHPDRIAGYFEALDARWKSPDVQRWSEEFRTARERADYAESSAARLREVLRGVEWGCRTGVANCIAACPSCLNDEEGGHVEGCALAAALESPLTLR